MNAITTIVFKFRRKTDIDKVENILEKFYDNKKLFKTFQEYDIEYPNTVDEVIADSSNSKDELYHFRTIIIDDIVNKDKISCFRKLIKKLNLKQTNILYITEYENGYIETNDVSYRYAEKYHYISSLPNEQGEYEVFTSSLDKIVKDVNFTWKQEFTKDNVFKSVEALNSKLDSEYLFLYETKIVRM